MRLSLQHRYRSVAGLLLRMLAVACLLLPSALPAAATHPHRAQDLGPVVADAASSIDLGHCPSGHDRGDRLGLQQAHHCASAYAGCCMLPTTHFDPLVTATSSAWPDTEIGSAGLVLTPPLPPPIVSSGA
ncbi:hypothetical protein [Benzoatithermus flavus]|uniref:Secreted protein n=1 Tax=Benzoatithermus flavus TaxID=3108223 RepID=A0ABU8XPQ6_9PROT